MGSAHETKGRPTAHLELVAEPRFERAFGKKRLNAEQSQADLDDVLGGAAAARLDDVCLGADCDFGYVR